MGGGGRHKAAKKPCKAKASLKKPFKVKASSKKLASSSSASVPPSLTDDDERIDGAYYYSDGKLAYNGEQTWGRNRLDYYPPHEKFVCPRKTYDAEGLVRLRETDQSNYDRLVSRPIPFAIQEINAETGKDYKLRDIVNVVTTPNYGVYYTFTTTLGCDVQTFRTLMFLAYGPTGLPLHLIEWTKQDPSGGWSDIVFSRPWPHFL